MNTGLETGRTSSVSRGSAASKPRAPRARVYLFLLLIWSILVGGGLWGAKLYTDHLRAQIAAEIAAQTDARLAQVQQEYTAQITGLRATLTEDMAKLQTKIDTVNELLAFTKDSASSKTDNSNQLYTQLAEVTAKLEELKKQLDALQ